MTKIKHAGEISAAPAWQLLEAREPSSRWPPQYGDDIEIETGVKPSSAARAFPCMHRVTKGERPGAGRLRDAGVDGARRQRQQPAALGADSAGGAAPASIGPERARRRIARGSRDSWKSIDCVQYSEPADRRKRPTGRRAHPCPRRKRAIRSSYTVEGGNPWTDASILKSAAALALLASPAHRTGAGHDQDPASSCRIRASSPTWRRRSTTASSST